MKDICAYTISKKYTLQLPRCFLDLNVVAFLVDLSPANLSLRGLNERSRHSLTRYSVTAAVKTKHVGLGQ